MTKKLLMVAVVLAVVTLGISVPSAHAVRTCCTYCGNEVFSTETASSCSGSENAVANNLLAQARADCGGVTEDCSNSSVTFTETCKPVSGGFQSAGSMDFSCLVPCGLC